MKVSLTLALGAALCLHPFCPQANGQTVAPAPKSPASSSKAPVKKTPPGKLITLEQAYDRTLSSDQSIALAEVALQQAELEPAAARVKLSPTISADASGTARDNRTVSGYKSSYNGGVSVQQPLLDLSYQPALRRGRLAVAAAGMDYQRQVRETLFGVAEAYYNLLGQQRLVEVGQESLRLAEEQLSLAQIRANVGDVTNTDVLRTKVTVETARRTLLQDEKTLQSMKQILANILNLEPGTEYRVTDPPDYSGKIPPYRDMLYQALAQREDIRSQDLLVDRSAERVNEVRGNYAPKIVAQADASSSEQGDSGDFANDLQGSVVVRIPIFSGGQKAIDLRNADLETQQLRLQREQVIKAVEQEVKDAWLDARTSMESLPGLRVQVDAADQSYRDLQLQYKAGDARIVDVLTALNELNDARKDLALETYRWQLAQRNLQRAVGTFQTERLRKVKTP